METNKIIADFDDRKYIPYKNNNSIDIQFNTYKECSEWLKNTMLEGTEIQAYPEHKPELGWNVGFGDYHKSWDWLMPVIEKISSIEMTYKNVDETYFSYPQTFGMKDEEGLYMFRFHVGQLFKEEKLIDAAYKAVINFLKNL